MSILVRTRSEWVCWEEGKGTTVTEFSDKYQLFKSMHKTKPITKEHHAHRHIQASHAPSSPPQQTSDSPQLLPWSLQSVKAEHNFTIDDFLRSLQAEQPPYYPCHISDPYFEPYFGHESDADQPTAPLRTRPCIDRINQQYMESIGLVGAEMKEGGVRVEREVRVKYFRGEDEAEKIGAYQEYVEQGKQGEEMEWQSGQ